MISSMMNLVDVGWGDFVHLPVCVLIVGRFQEEWLALSDSLCACWLRHGFLFLFHCRSLSPCGVVDAPRAETEWQAPEARCQGWPRHTDTAATTSEEEDQVCDQGCDLFLCVASSSTACKTSMAESESSSAVGEAKAVRQVHTCL